MSCWPRKLSPSSPVHHGRRGPGRRAAATLAEIGAPSSLSPDERTAPAGRRTGKPACGRGCRISTSRRRRTASIRLDQPFFGPSPCPATENMKYSLRPSFTICFWRPLGALSPLGAIHGRLGKGSRWPLRFSAPCAREPCRAAGTGIPRLLGEVGDLLHEVDGARRSTGSSAFSYSSRRSC